MRFLGRDVAPLFFYFLKEACAPFSKIGPPRRISVLLIFPAPRGGHARRGSRGEVIFGSGLGSALPRLQPSTFNLQPSTFNHGCPTLATVAPPQPRQPHLGRGSPASGVVAPPGRSAEGSTFNLQPSTFNLRPSTFNLQPSTFDLRPSTFNLQPSTFIRPWTFVPQPP